MASNTAKALIGGKTPDQILMLVDALLAIAKQNPAPAEMIAVAPKSLKKLKQEKKKTYGRIIAAKRPLNSFMAFRAFYWTMFPNYQQKEISAFVHRLWTADYFKAKWTIIAKAYSIIRDSVGKSNAPLVGFLQIACPFVGVVPPSHYMVTFGWILPQGQTGLIREHTPSATHFVTTTSLSPQDVVAFAKGQGYAPDLTSKLHFLHNQNCKHC
jgi:hypothetical protein